MDRIEIVRIISQLLRCAEWAIVACAEVCKLFEISAISGQPIDQVELRPSAESFSIGSNRVDLGRIGSKPGEGGTWREKRSNLTPFAVGRSKSGSKLGEKEIRDAMRPTISAEGRNLRKGFIAGLFATTYWSSQG